MKSFFRVFVTMGAFMALSSQAHESTDWRQDRQAYEYTRRALRTESLTQARVARPSREFLDLAVDPIWFRERLAELSGAVPVVVDGKRVTISERKSAANRTLARSYLAEQFSALGFQVAMKPYLGGVNLVAEKAGRDPSKVLVLSAHLDSVGNAGANDDGTGVIAGLSVARALSTLDLRHSVRFVAFDQEEGGLIGSRQYARGLTASERAAIIGDIQMEMMGVNSRRDGAFHVIDCDRPESKFLTQRILEAIAALGLPITRSPACTDRSDHSAFWGVRVPAVAISENFFGGDSDPCYHARCDVLDQRLDFEYMARITRAVASASASLVEAN